ncbi:MAG: hypothetical protein MUD05_10275, partial [Candidatus Nanopelagicales bacterium]|nr:hypothetical protein [Candidatus Nanopelagicales bacterium]
MSAVYLCCQPDRLVQVRAYNEGLKGPAARKQLNAIESLEVVDTEYLTMGLDAKLAETLRQRTLLVRCLLPVAALGAEQVRILGGERITPVEVEWAHPANALPAESATDAERVRFGSLPEPAKLLVMRTDRAGDFSRYRLEMVASTQELEPIPHPAFDPRLWHIAFSFKVECPTDFDCREPLVCPEPPAEAPAINYLAKDYASFRRLLLDRISQLIPNWKPRSPADLGLTLVEWLAYVGDHLSYQQDAIATEAYLATCRSRISLRRHARLMDYFVSEGCNARAWVQIQVDADIEGTEEHPAIPERTRLLTRLPNQPVIIADAGPLLDQADAVFETRHPVQSLYAKHENIPFYTWGETECCLPAGATAATLKGHFPALKGEDVLIFEEVTSPVTGESADADLNRRHAVRLTRVRAFGSSGASPLRDPIGNTAITEIEWHAADALPFALILSRKADRKPLPTQPTTPGPLGPILPGNGGKIGDTEHDEADRLYSVARGNIVVADHGLTVPWEDLGMVEESRVRVAATAGDDPCDVQEGQPLPPRYRPRLARKPLTHRCPYDASLAASLSLVQDPSAALPLDLEVSAKADDEADGRREHWTLHRDLLGRPAMDPDFVAEIETDG